MKQLFQLLQGDCLVEMKKIEENTIDAIITDPPYGIKFMGKKWDYDIPSIEIWKQCLRILKPGGHLLAFSGTRTYHRMASAIEDAGFEVRDMIEWVYGSGFPKSLNIGKAVDKLQGNEREKISRGGKCGVFAHSGSGVEQNIDDYETIITKGTSEWEGWGTALKPAHEPICMARKPLAEKTVAENVLKYGTGGINIDESRVETEDKLNGGAYSKGEYDTDGKVLELGLKRQEGKYEQPLGRFPANLIHDDSEEVRECFPDAKGWAGQNHNNFNPYGGNALNKSATTRDGFHEGFGDSGSASRFFKSIIYQAKASKSERNKGCESFPSVARPTINNNIGGQPNQHIENNKNFHPTVKPIALMEYLIKLVSKEGAIVLDPFLGSGTTGIACKKLNRNFIGIELNNEYFEIAKARINKLNLNF